MFKHKLFSKNIGFQEIQFSCVVKFLDNNDPLTVTFHKNTSGQQVLDHVCASLDLAEKDYFGLRYVDQNKQRHWLDLKKTAFHQLKRTNPMELCFRLKYYPSNPIRLKEEITRYFLFLQLARDLQHGRLLCSQNEIIQLFSHLLQAKIGSNIDDISLFSSIIPQYAQKYMNDIIQDHKQLKHMTVEEAEMEFINLALSLDTYGVDPHLVKDANGNNMYIGVTYKGIATFQGNKRTSLLFWKEILKLDFEGKQFLIHSINQQKKKLLYFKCPSFEACKHLWKCAIEQQFFFTIESSSKAPKIKANKGLFRRSSSFRFSGLCESEVWTSTSSLNRSAPIVQRSPSAYFNRNQSKYETMPTSIKPNMFHLTDDMSRCSITSSSPMQIKKALNADSIEDHHICDENYLNGENLEIVEEDPELVKCEMFLDPHHHSESYDVIHPEDSIQVGTSNESDDSETEVFYEINNDSHIEEIQKNAWSGSSIIGFCSSVFFVFIFAFIALNIQSNIELLLSEIKMHFIKPCFDFLSKHYGGR